MTVRWGLIVEEVDGLGERKAGAANVLEHLTGTREQALERLAEPARRHVPQHPANSSRTRLYRTAEGFLLVNQGSVRSYGCRFSVAELLYDSEEAERAERAARKAAEKAAKRASRSVRRRG